jgi:transcription elongation GreA/GreB family factor
LFATFAPVSIFLPKRRTRAGSLSVAFTREEDLEAAAAHLPDRPLSPHPNLVTPEGLAELDRALAAARAAYATAQVAGDVQADRTAMALAARDLRYYAARRASAQVVQSDTSAGTVVFGSRVTFEREDGRRQTFRIVGEDEADAKMGSVSYISPLARALLGRRAGDVASLSGAEIEVIAVE